MYDNDYIVLVDENGQPYIAHAWRDWVRSAPAAAKNSARTAGRKATKYIEKIVDKGKARYFYTQDELKAYYNNARNKAASTYKNAKENLGRTVDRVTGLGVRKDMKTAEKKAEESQRKAEREQRRAEQAGRIADAARSNAESKWDPLQQAYADQADAVKAVRSAPESISAYDEAIRKQKEADDKVEQRRADNNKAWETSLAQAQRAQDAELRAIRAQNDAKNDRSTADFLKDIYADTPLGRIEGMANSAKNAFNSAKDTVSRWGDTALDSISSAANSAKDKASDAVSSAKNAVTNAAKEALGYGAKERAEQFRKNMDRAEEEFWANGNRALDAFVRRNNNDPSSVAWKNADAAGARRQADMDDALDAYNRYSSEYRANRRAYNNSPAAVIDRATEKAKTISASAAKALQEKWQAGKELTQNEMNQLMSFLMKDYK